MVDQYRVIIQPEAYSAMEDAYLWIESQSGSTDTAHKWVAGLMGAIDSLSSMPARCPLAPDNDAWDEEVRVHFYGKKGGVYRILFTIKHDAVNILLIRHSAREWMGTGE